VEDVMIGRSWRGVALVGVAFVLAGCPKKEAGPSDAAAEAGPAASTAPTDTAPPPAATSATPTHVACAKGYAPVGNYCGRLCTDDSMCPTGATCTGTGKYDDGTNKNFRFCVAPPGVDAGSVPVIVVDAGPAPVVVVDAGPAPTKVIRVAHGADAGPCAAGFKLAGQFCRLTCTTSADCGGTSSCKVFSTAGGSLLCADPL
jgi:hypothetical protein